MLLERMKAWSIAGAALLLSAWVGMPVLAAVEEDDEEPKYAPGLVASYSAVPPRSESFQRVDEQVQFVWREAPPDARLSGSSFSATWDGLLFTQTPGDYRFHVF